MNTTIEQWTERRVSQMTEDIKSLIDLGSDLETAIDLVFDASILATSHKMRVLENVGNYRHEHIFILDVITGKNWCKTCQIFE